MPLWNWSPGHGGAETGTRTTRDRPPWLSMTINSCCRAPPGSATEAPSLDLGPKENYVAFPLSHHESAGLDKHVSSARAFLVMWSQPSLSRTDQVTPSRQASHWVGQSGLELVSLAVHPFFPSSPTLVSSRPENIILETPNSQFVASFGLEARLTAKPVGCKAKGSKLHLEEVWICAPGLRVGKGLSRAPLSFPPQLQQIPFYLFCLLEL